MTVLLDSDVLVDYLRGLPAAGRYVDGLAVTPTCSEVTRVEVLRGMRSHERRVTERFLATIRWVGVDQEISTRPATSAGGSGGATARSGSPTWSSRLRPNSLGSRWRR